MDELPELEEPEVVIVTRTTDGEVVVEYGDPYYAMWMLQVAISAVLEREEEDETA